MREAFDDARQDGDAHRAAANHAQLVRHPFPCLESVGGCESSQPSDFTRDPGGLTSALQKYLYLPLQPLNYSSPSTPFSSLHLDTHSATMGLVDYGSDSDSDSPASAAPTPAPAPPTRAKRRILLDLPAPSAATTAQASKRLKPETGDPSSTTLTGLAAMLPKPKNSNSAPPSAPAAPPKAAEGPSRLDVLLAGADKAPRGNMLLPPAVAAAAKRKQEQAPPAPAADFFGISELFKGVSWGVPPP